jgi:asparagine synthase (glutamine-hydrolysing)
MWLFEYVAIMWLKKENVLSDEAVFVPGHAADFNAGSHLMKACMAPNSSAIYSANAIAFDNFEYGCHQNVWYKIYQHFSTYKKINNDVPNWSIFQDFVFSNRLPYNVNNSARVYQFFNYDIRLPYWDYEFLEFFRRMPWDELYRCGFYTHFIREYIFKEMNVDFSREYPSDQYYFRMKLRKRLVRLLPDCVRNKVKKSDVLGEVILSKPMFDELCQKKLYKETAKCSANQIMKDWYLLKIREMLLQI